MQEWSATLELRPLPLFCARERILGASWSMLTAFLDAEDRGPAPPPTSALVLSTPNTHTWIGKTRTLEEIARLALSNGCLPLLIRPTPDDSPKDVRELAQMLADAFDLLVDQGLVAEVEATELRWLTQSLETGAVDLGAHRSVADELRRSPWRGLREALCQDAATVLDAARAAHPTLMGAGARLIVLLDNLGQSSLPLLSAMFGPGGVGPYGMGRKGQPIPLVAVMLGTGDDIRRQIGDRVVDTARWIDVHPLRPFSADGEEDLLAYESVLLYPFRGADGSLASKPWVFNRALGPDQWDAWTTYLRRNLEGLPGRFGKAPEFELVLDAIYTARFLDPVVDEKLVVPWR
jgi:hypothetical protein